MSKERFEMLKAMLKQGLRVHPSQIAELRAAGIEVPKSIIVPEDTIPSGVICSEYTGPASLVLLDNAITPCAWGCGRKLQHRPHFLPKVQKVCAYCFNQRGEGKDQ